VIILSLLCTFNVCNKVIRMPVIFFFLGGGGGEDAFSFFSKKKTKFF